MRSANPRINYKIVATQQSSTMAFLAIALLTVVMIQLGFNNGGILCEHWNSASPRNKPQARPTASSKSRQVRSVYLATIDDSRYSYGNNGALGGNLSISSASAHHEQYNEQPPVLSQCCACDEAKYELVFEGLWSRYTHPDEFPESYWDAHFGDIIGASHSNEFKMWSNGSLATEGVKELAENGSTKRLESELKQVSSKTRTIIKARELRYPTLNSKTSAVFRTDRAHHLVSVLSKLGPSPDWMVGVSALELCQSDCSWAIHRVVNLYLWDAGTDSGDSFTARDTPTYPQEPIRARRKESTKQSQGSALKMSFASSLNEQRRPYQSEPVQTSADAMPAASSFGVDQQKPFARLTVTRQRIYEKSCNDSVQQPPFHRNTAQTSSVPSSFPNEPTTPSYSDCRFTEWSDWSTCSSICGRGIRTRTRSFLDEQAHLAGCSQVDLIEKEICLSECVGNVTCVTRDWTEWSKCSVNCGQGFRKRTRAPIGAMKRSCESVEYAQMELCSASPPTNCSSEPSTCELTDWSQWSDCSVACGKGTKIRTRQFLRRDSIANCSGRYKLIQKQSCVGRAELCNRSPGDYIKTCTKPNDPGPCKAYIERWYFSEPRGMCAKFVYGGCLGNQQSTTTTNPKSNPNLPVIDCKLSAWSPWSTCSALCGTGKRTRSRYVIQMPQNGGKPCDRRLARYQQCKDLPPCPQDFNQQNFPTAFRQASTKNTSGTNNNNKQQLQPPNTRKQYDWRVTTTTTTTTTPDSSMMDDEDDSKFSRLLQSESGLIQPASYWRFRLR